MSADRLLLWMSARTRGSWPQFRAAVEQLHVPDEDGEQADAAEESGASETLPLYQRLRLNIQRAGHAEFSPGPRIEWRVTPPSLAVSHRRDGVLGVVAGARSLRLLDKLSALAGSRLQTVQQGSCPVSLCIRAGDAAELEELAKNAGLHVQMEAPRALLTCLPPVDDPLVLDPSIRRRDAPPLGVGWRIEQFDARALRWREAQRDAVLPSRLDLFRFSLAYQHSTWLCDRGSVFEITAQVGKFVVARRRHRRLLRYNSKGLTLRVPAIFRPPFLIERALILSSGCLPRYQWAPQGGGVLEYLDVPAEVARLAAAILRQELSYE